MVYVQEFLRNFEIQTNNPIPGGLVGWGCRIHRLLLCRRVRLRNECTVYDLKQSDGEAPVMMELWGMLSTPLLPSVPGPLWPGAVASDRALFMYQIELYCVLMLN